MWDSIYYGKLYGKLNRYPHVGIWLGLFFIMKDKLDNGDEDKFDDKFYDDDYEYREGVCGAILFFLQEMK